MKITDASHTDHGLTNDHLAFITSRFQHHEGALCVTLEMPAELPDLTCGLYGPSMGDGVIQSHQVQMAHRGERPYKSRLVAMPPRPTRLLTVIGGTHDGECILFTAFGGPATPREPGDPSITTPQGRADSDCFWGDHALSDPRQRTVRFEAEYREDYETGRQYVGGWQINFEGAPGEKPWRWIPADDVHTHVELAQFLGARIEWRCHEGDEPNL
jgi:hypothetical protein